MSHHVATRRRFLRLAALGAAGSLAACAVAPTGGGTTTASAPAAPPPEGGTVTARGSFVGKSRHETTGHARIVFADGAVRVELEDDFTFDGAPDPKVALGRDGYDPNTILGALGSNSGAQSYPLKPGLDIADYNEVWIWCERFSVPLGVATLQLT
ncbi:MAG: DM13 domain-containing protein [Pseudomonadota bacterium]